MGDFGGGFNGDGGPPSGPPSLGGPDLGSVINLVFDAFRSLTNAINFVWGKLQWLYGILGGLFKGLRKFLSHIWKAYIKAAIGWLAKHAWSVQSWLGRHLKSAIKWMQKVKKWYDEHILKQQLRLLQQIQTIRRFLGILRLFHVKWATKLDGSLADLQNRIETSITIVRGTLNQIINTLALAFDPTMLLTRNVLGASLLANLGAVKRIFGFGDNRILSATEQATIAKEHALYNKSTVDAHVNALVSTGLTADDKARRTEFRKAFEEVRGAPLPI